MTVATTTPLARLGVESWALAVRRLAIAALIALGIASILVAIWSLDHGGIGLDSRGDTEAALVTRSIDTSWPLQRAYDAVESTSDTSEFYGVFPQQLADALHLATTGSTEPLGPDDPTTYQYQGAGNLLFSILAVTVFAVALALAFRSVFAAAFVWSLTLATPLWLGMSHVDFKDMPVAAGVTLVSAGLILSFVIGRARRGALVGALVAGTGGAIAVATRPGSIVLLAVLVGLTAATTLVWAVRAGRVREAAPLFATALAVPVCALAFTWVTNPIARIDLVQWLRDSIDVARNYPWEGTIRVAGQDVRSTDLPFWYVPAWLGAQLPLLTILAVVGGLAGLTVGLVRRRGRISAGTAIPFVPIALQAVVLPVVIVASGAVLYDGIRHVLFLIPALLAVPAVALALLERRAHDSRLRLAIVLPLAAVLVVGASLVSSIRWAPYAYAYLNPIAGYDTNDRDWELDYWGVTAREGVRRLRELGLSPVYVAPSPRPGVPFGAADAFPHAAGKAGLYVFFRWERASAYGCFVVFTIQRGGHALGEGARCPPD